MLHSIGVTAISLFSPFACILSTDADMDAEYWFWDNVLTSGKEAHSRFAGEVYGF